jgi:hypothetical protein
MSEIENVSTNPLETLSVEELNKFIEAIDEHFSVVTIKDEVVKDLHTRWWDLHSQCLKYAFWNHLEITEGYPEMSERSYGDIVKIMIIEQIKKNK